MNYTAIQIQAITGNMTLTMTCPKAKLPANNLNYPSIAAVNFTKAIKVVRTVTNVGTPTSVYKAEVHHPPGIHVTVKPDTLTFSDRKEVLSYTVTLSPMDTQPWRENWVFGVLIWDDDIHRVRTPIAVGPKMSSPFL